MLLVKQIRWDFCFGWSKSFSFALLFLVRRIYFDLYLRREAHLSLFCSIALGAAITFPLTLRLSICFQLTDAPTGLYFELLSYATVYSHMLFSVRQVVWFFVCVGPCIEHAFVHIKLSLMPLAVRSKVTLIVFWYYCCVFQALPVIRDLNFS
jgi:hypothetical protein